MEIFVDGGLFELVIFVALGYVINQVFKNKFFLIVYSVMIIGAPLLIIFMERADMFYILAAINVLNSILLVILLWQLRSVKSNEPLFNIKKYLPKKLRKYP